MQGLNNNASVATVAMLVFVIIQLLLQVTYAGPLNVRETLVIQENYTQLVTAQQNQSLETPSGNCLLDGQTIPKTSVTCEKKPGCRAIQKTGYCCPEYQCECERDGKTYSDGAKLDKIDPCNFCSCRGGEIVCSTVTCYNRDNCEPKYIPGTCCPVYDNCPLIDTKSTTTSHIPSADETSEQNSKLPPPQRKQEIMPKLNITIKEITKKEEIRIVGQNNPKIDDLINVKSNPENKLDIPDPIIIPTAEDSQKIIRQTDSNEKSTSEHHQFTTIETNLEMSNIEQKNTNMDQATEQVIIIDKDGQSKTIQVFDTKGLQRGDIAEDLVDTNLSEVIYDNTNLNSTQFLSFNNESHLNDSYLDLIPNASSDFFQIIINSTPETSDNSSYSDDKIYDTILYNGESENLLPNSTDDEKINDTLNHDSSDNETILNNDQLTSSTPVSSDNNYQIVHNTELEYDATPIENPAYPVIKDEDLSNYQREIENEDYPEGMPWTKAGAITELHNNNHHHHHHHQHNQLKEESRRIEMSTSENPINSNKTLQKSLSDIKIDNDDLIEGSADLSYGLPEPRAPGEPCLIPEWERNLTTNYTESRCNNSISLISDNDDQIMLFNLLKNNETDDVWQSSSESIELDLGSGSGMGIIMQNESTTKHHLIIDIDDIVIKNLNDSTLNVDSINPKDDVENVKSDDSYKSLNDTIV